MPDWTKVLALHLMEQEESMDMSDPSVQQMLDDDRAEALARIRAAKDVASCTSDDPNNHQGDTCPVHEANEKGE